MRVYIAGPARGFPDWNSKAFIEAEERWRNAGHHVFSPMSTTKALGYRWGGGAPAEPSTDVARLRHVLFTDIGSILAADAIALLPGWQRSRGATMEVAIAQFLGLPIYNAMTMDIIDLPKTPWGLLCDLKFEVAQTCTLVLNDLEELKKLEDN